MADADYEAIVVGAGVVGLAVAARLAARWPDGVLVVERHDGICREASSRNSEVVHAGFYYPPGSLKGRSCARGRELLYARCAERGLPFRRTGKFVVATAEHELAGLEELLRRGGAHGVPGLALVDAAALRRAEPEVAGIAALWSPASGIVDSHQLASSFERDLQARGGALALRTSLEGVERGANGIFALALRGGTERVVVRSPRVVNAAGLDQDRVSTMAGIDVDGAGLRTHAWVGRWWDIAARHRGRVRSLIYPVGSAAAPGLGIHLCLDLGGGMRLGPDAELRPRHAPLLEVPPEGHATFFAAGSALFPWLESSDLSPAQAGVRCKLVDQPGVFTDFVVREEAARGLPGWVSMAGIESPGLTACMALAEEVDAALLS